MKRKAAQQKRRYRKRRKNVKSKSQIGQIVRFIKNNKPELKVAYYQATPTFDIGTNSWKTYNLIYQMCTQGVGESSFVGKKFHLKGIAVKYSVRNDSVFVSGSGPYYGYTGTRMLLFGHKDYATTSNLSRGEVVASEFTVDPWKFSVDADKVRVKKSVLVQTNPAPFAAASAVQGQEQWKHGSFYVPINRDIVFERWNVDYKIKGDQLYLALNGAVVGTTSNLVQSHSAAIQIKMYYTDD